MDEIIKFFILHNSLKSNHIKSPNFNKGWEEFSLSFSIPIRAQF